MRHGLAYARALLYQLHPHRWFWQPIATAPRSGAPLLLWDPYYLMRIGRYEIRAVAEIWGREVPPGAAGHWVSDLPYGGERGEVEMPLEPTHWRHLPLVPKYMWS